MNIKLTSIVRNCKDHMKITIYKDSELRLNCKVGDILVIEVENYKLIRPIQEDYCLALPIGLLSKYKEKEKIELTITGIYIRKESQKRPVRFMKDNLLDLRYFVPIKTQFDMPIYIMEKDSDHSIVWYPRGGSARPITIRNYVDPVQLSELMGFFYGDGSKSKGLRSFRITNCEPFILKYCMKILDYIVMEKSDYRCQVIYSTNKCLTEEIKTRCIEFWSKELRLKKESFVSVSMTKTKNESLLYGSLRIQNNNTVLAEVFLYGVLNRLVAIILNPKNKIEHNMLEGFLRGILAAEGYPTTDNEMLRTVRIAFNPHSEEPQVFTKLLKNLNIESKIRKNNNSLVFYRYENFLKLYKMKAFSLYPSKNKRFEESFLELQKSFL